MIEMAQPLIGDDETAAVVAVLESGMLAQGREVAAFEEEFSQVVVDDARCIAVNSGTSALHLALLALGAGPGDEVIVPSFTFAATANAVAMTGATPIFCDIDPRTFCIDAQLAASLVGPKTAGIVPVHLYGLPADMTEISKLAARKGLFVLEDAAQAHAAEVDGDKVGALGHAGAFSFYPTKNMTTGEGGMVVTRDAEIERIVRLLRNQGQEVRYRNEIPGLNNRMTEMAAAIGRVQLTKLMGWTERRREIADFYGDELAGVITPLVPPGLTHVFHQYTIRVPGLDRDWFAERLKSRGVQTGIYYPTPVHRLPAYDLQLELPATQEISEQCLSLPIRPGLSEADLHVIVESVNDVAAVGS